MILKLSDESLSFVIEMMKKKDVFLKKAYTVNYTPAVYHSYRHSTEESYMTCAELIDESIELDLLKIKKGNAVRANVISKKIHENSYNKYFLLEEDIINALPKGYSISLDEENVKYLMECEFEKYKDIRNIDKKLFEINRLVDQKNKNDEDVVFYFKNRESLKELGVSVLHLKVTETDNSYFTPFHERGQPKNITDLFRKHEEYFKNNKLNITDNKYLIKNMNFSESLLLESMDIIGSVIKNNNDLKDTQWGKATSSLLEMFFENYKNYIYNNLNLFKGLIDIVSDSEFSDIKSFKKWVEENKIYNNEIEIFWIDKDYKYLESLEMDTEILLNTFPTLYKKVNSTYRQSRDVFLELLGKVLKDGIEMGHNVNVEVSASVTNNKYIINLNSDNVIEVEKIKKLIKSIIKDLLTEKTLVDYTAKKEDCLNRLSKVVLSESIVKNEKSGKFLKF